MKASEVAAKLLELADLHGDPHVYALGNQSEYVQAVEPESVFVVRLGAGLSPMVMIVGLTMAQADRLLKS